MRLRRIHASICLVMMWAHTSSAGDRPYSVGLYGSYTTTSKIFFNPEAANEVERNRFFDVDNIFSLGLDVRRDISYNLRVGLSVEYISASTKVTPIVRDRTGRFFELAEEDGYRLIPVELSGYFIIPFSSDRVKVYMGGGVGLYLGERRVEVVGITAETLEKNAGFGIHVMSGVEYRITPILLLRGEMKFRDPQVESTNKFPEGPFQEDGHTFLFQQGPFRSRINIDGITFNVGTVLQF